MTEYYPAVWLRHILLFTHLLMDIWVVLRTVNNATMNISVHVFV